MYLPFKSLPFLTPSPPGRNNWWRSPAPPWWMASTPGDEEEDEWFHLFLFFARARRESPRDKEVLTSRQILWPRGSPTWRSISKGRRRRGLARHRSRRLGTRLSTPTDNYPRPSPLTAGVAIMLTACQQTSGGGRRAKRAGAGGAQVGRMYVCVCVCVCVGPREQVQWGEKMPHVTPCGWCHRLPPARLVEAPRQSVIPSFAFHARERERRQLFTIMNWIRVCRAICFRGPISEAATAP